MSHLPSATDTSVSSALPLRPLVKWVGGKRQLLPEIMGRLPSDFSHFVEPFFGGGAVLFAIQPQFALINDLNTELMNVYTVVRDYPQKLIQHLRKHARQHCEDYFYEVRQWDRKASYNQLEPATRAARLIYLNRTCYNGLYRVNSRGEFNTPIGRYKNPRILDEDAITAMSQYFNSADITITSTDYRDAITTVLEKPLSQRKKTLVYLDPPYMPLSKTSSFVSYTGDGFDETEQVALYEQCCKLDEAGVRFLLSNSAHKTIVDLYKDFHQSFVSARRNVNSVATKRGSVEELLVSNYDISCQ